jgi:hypothetical protein
MGDDRAQDLLSIDRDVSRGWAAWSEWRAAVASDPEAYGDDEPLEGVRRVAGQSMAEALAALSPPARELPLRDALRRWVMVLTQSRIQRPDDAAWALSAAEPRGHFSGEPPRAVAWREAWRGVALAKTEAECALWLASAAEAAPALADVARRRAERRLEVARRLGVSHPWAPLVAVDPGALRGAAARLLDATEDLAHEVWRHALGRGASMPAVLHAAVARDAGEGWPARLTARWIEERFGAATRGLSIRLDALPSPAGASSFARAIGAFGFAVASASAPPSVPFALAHDPATVGPHRLGFALASFTADAAWQARALGVGARVAQAQARVLARTALLDARLHAARLLLGDDADFAPRELFEELGVRLFGSRVPPELAGAWPAARDDEPGRFIALLGAQAFAGDLRARFDADWYRNPRAWTELRAPLPSAPIAAGDAQALVAQADALARAFAEALG